ncbi:MAG TPA: RHS repeat-associated core domain-containing protein [Acidobacteriota bacterium]|nr:RHS repeat-associated core domain-containing protein [Acidobacteriota bacterium]HNT17210.1 RHS repeat-associated core domain-containing protein [Acidobacteriota bacterium]
MSATECGSFSLADFTLKQTTFEPFHEDTHFNATDETPLVAYKVRVNFEGNLPLPESECKWTHVGFCYDRPYVEWIHGSFTGNFNADGAPIVTVEWAAAGPLSSTVYDLWRNGKYEIYDISGNSITFAIGGHPDSIDVTHEFGVRAVNLLDGCLSDLVTCTVTVPGDLTECPPEAGDILIKTNIVGPVYDGNGDLTGIKIQIVWSGETGSYIKILRSFEGCGGEFEERDSVSVTENYYYDILQSGQIATYKVVSGRNNCDLVGESDCYTINVTPMTGLNEGTVYFYVKDHLGNTRLVLDRDGYIQSRMDYEPYGIELYPLAANSSREKYKFTNQERDYTTGLDYMHFRYYGSNIGRFMKPDKMGGQAGDPQSWNKYSYCKNNSITCHDPDGLFGRKAHEEIAEASLERFVKQGLLGTIKDFSVRPDRKLGFVRQMGRHFDMNPNPNVDSRDVAAEKYINKGRQQELLGNGAQAAEAYSMASHFIADKWGHRVAAGTDAQGNTIFRDVGPVEHVLRNIGGFIQKLFGGKDTLSPDSENEPSFKERKEKAEEETKAKLAQPTEATATSPAVGPKETEGE